MTIRMIDGVVKLEGDCSLEDATLLLDHLLNDNPSHVDWTACRQAHTGVVQVLMASGARIVGPAKNAFLNRYIAPAVGRLGD